MEVDFSYALDLAGRINRLSFEGRPIYAFRRIGEYSAWAFHQYHLHAEIKEFSRTKNFTAYAAARRPARFWERTRVIVYQALALAVSLFAILRLIILRRRLLMYCVDAIQSAAKSDSRLAGVYAFLQEHSIKFVEVFHTVFGKRFLTNLCARRRAVLYLEAIDALFEFRGSRQRRAEARVAAATVPLDAFEEFEQPFVRQMLEEFLWRCYRSEFKVKLFELILRFSGVRLLIAIDDLRYYNELLLACKLAGVRTYVFQHSNFDYLTVLDRLPPESCVFPDTLFVWSNYWLKRLAKANPLFRFHKARLEIGGSAVGGFRSEMPFRLPPPHTPHEIRILIPYEVFAPKAEVRTYIEKLRACEKVCMIFKVRPDMPREVQVREYMLAELLETREIQVVSSMTEEELDRVSLVVGVYSTYLNEFIEAGKPVALLKTSFLTFNDLAAEDLAGMLDIRQANLCAQAQKAIEVPAPILQRRSAMLREGAVPLSQTLSAIIRKHGLVPP